MELMGIIYLIRLQHTHTHTHINCMSWLRRKVNKQLFFLHRPETLLLGLE